MVSSLVLSEPHGRWPLDIRARSETEVHHLERDVPVPSTCLCKYHMQFCELCTGLYHFRKQLRDERLIQCECKKENLLDPMKVRALLTCDRPEGTRYDQPDCYNSNCSDCKDAKRLEAVLFCKHELDFLQRDVTWQSWREGETYNLKKKKDGTERKRKEFTSEQAFPVYVENIIVRDIQLVALLRQPDILQLRAEDSKKIVLVLPREGWFFHHRPSLPWDASAVTTTGQVTNQHKQRLAADENYLAASLKVPRPKKKTLRSEGASQRKIVQRQEAGMTLRLRPRPARE